MLRGSMAHRATVFQPLFAAYIQNCDDSCLRYSNGGGAGRVNEAAHLGRHQCLQPFFLHLDEAQRETGQWGVKQARLRSGSCSSMHRSPRSLLDST